jgi:uncharacterized membrane protein
MIPVCRNRTPGRRQAKQGDSMEAGIGLLILVVLGAVLGAALGWVSFFRVGTLRNQVSKLQYELTVLQRQLGQAEPPATASTTETAHISSTVQTDSPAWPPQPKGRAGKTAATATLPDRGQRWLSVLQDNWMIWLGGISVALAGVFMVKYSIEVGLLGPKARILFAVITGLGLHAIAEWLRRRTGGSDPVFAALAGGASITLYAALLAALHLYHLLDPRWVFMLLALVSLMTMALSLLHGPELAIIGLIGAYVVPVLVDTNSGNMVAAMTYSLIISGAALLLLRYVFRYWLWWGIIAGSLGWWLISLGAGQADLFRGPYLALLAWGLLAIPGLDWLLRGQHPTAAQGPGERPVIVFAQRLQLNQLSLFLVILAWGFSIFRQGFSPEAAGLWAPLVVVLCFASRRRDGLALLPWITLVVQWLAWLVSVIHFDAGFEHFELAGLAPAVQPQLLAFAGLMSLLYTALALLHVRERGFSHSWMSLALLAPLAWLALAYLLVNGLSQSLHWSLAALFAGAAYATLAVAMLQRHRSEGTALWLTLGANLAYSLAVTMYFREAGLSLALAAQLLSLSWLMKRHQLPWLGYLVKLVLAVVVIRLTLNPWLMSYPSDVHWSLWTYGGATLFSALAAMQCRSSPALQQWLEAATLHLLVLTLGAELRYWLYDGAIFIHRYSLTEAAINTSLWAGLALAYYRRGRVSVNLGELYRAASRILLVLSLCSYGVAAVIQNPLWSNVSIGSIPVLNILLLAYGLPVIMALLVARYHEAGFRRQALGFAGLASLLFVSLEIRHLWQGGRIALYNTTGDGELYTYSIIWLLMSIAAIVAGTSWRVRDLYKAGITLLAVVIAKIFLVDMSGLEGLWRVASFMGLGLSLLGLAWLHRRIAQTRDTANG